MAQSGDSGDEPMDSFLEQYRENVRAYRRRWPQRLLKVAIVFGAVVIVAPVTSVVGKAFGPTAAFVVAFGGLLATLIVWWLASLILSHATAPPSEPIAPAPSPLLPAQPASPFSPQPLPVLTPTAPPAPRSNGVGLVIVAIAGVMLLSCCGGGAVLVAVLTSIGSRTAAPAGAEAVGDPMADLHAEQQRRMKEMLQRQQQQFRDMEKRLQREPFGK
jgi:hypothetical protein